MSTRSNIAIRNADGSVTSVYCHWDGYPTNNGKILLRSYKTPTKVARLVKGGAISSLHDRLFTRKPHSFDKPAEGVVVAYSRDRHEDWDYCKPTTYANEEEWRKGDLEEWGYLYKDGSWFVVDCHCKTEDRKIVPLTKSYIYQFDKNEKRECISYALRDEKEISKDGFRVFRVPNKMLGEFLAEGFLTRTKNGYAVR